MTVCSTCQWRKRVVAMYRSIAPDIFELLHCCINRVFVRMDLWRSGYSRRMSVYETYFLFMLSLTHFSHYPVHRCIYTIREFWVLISYFSKIFKFELEIRISWSSCGNRNFCMFKIFLQTAKREIHESLLTKYVNSAVFVEKRQLSKYLHIFVFVHIVIGNYSAKYLRSNTSANL